MISFWRQDAGCCGVPVDCFRRHHAIRLLSRSGWRHRFRVGRWSFQCQRRPYSIVRSPPATVLITRTGAVGVKFAGPVFLSQCLLLHQSAAGQRSMRAYNVAPSKALVWRATRPVVPLNPLLTGLRRATFSVRLAEGTGSFSVAPYVHTGPHTAAGSLIGRMTPPHAASISVGALPVNSSVLDHLLTV